MSQLEVQIKLAPDSLLNDQSRTVIKDPWIRKSTGVVESVTRVNDETVRSAPTAACKRTELGELYAENVIAKMWRVASRGLEINNPPTRFPETVPQEGGGKGDYEYRDADFWTCGFFPGTLFSLLERLTLYPDAMAIPQANVSTDFVKIQLLGLCRAWTEPIHSMTARTDTHDLGFIVEPALRLDWELTGNKKSLQSVIKAAHSLATRFDARVEAIRSWDLIKKRDLEVIGMEENFVVIIDSLCNLDLLFYASSQSGDRSLAGKARAHALTCLKTHLRPEISTKTSKTGYRGRLFSTCHVANLDPKTGTMKDRMTAQGYSKTSTWSRGQAWAILGYAQTYTWTKDTVFLDAACGLAEYFLQRMGDGHKVPPWDFDAPIEDPENPVLDSSAGAIAANGMLLISEVLAQNHQLVLSNRFRDGSVELVKALLNFSLSEEKARFATLAVTEDCNLSSKILVEDVEQGKSFDAILKYSTANNNVGANRRYWNHGLVYADYYLVRFGNELLRMGLSQKSDH